MQLESIVSDLCLGSLKVSSEQDIRKYQAPSLLVTRTCNKHSARQSASRIATVFGKEWSLFWDRVEREVSQYRGSSGEAKTTREGLRMVGICREGEQWNLEAEVDG